MTPELNSRNSSQFSSQTHQLQYSMEVEFRSTSIPAPKPLNIDLGVKLMTNYLPMPLLSGKKFRFVLFLQSHPRDSSVPTVPQAVGAALQSQRRPPLSTAAPSPSHPPAPPSRAHTDAAYPLSGTAAPRDAPPPSLSPSVPPTAALASCSHPVGRGSPLRCSDLDCHTRI
jgi:hypothetical protein